MSLAHAELLAKIKPMTLATDRVLPVPEALLPLFPWGGLQRGIQLGVGGTAGWSLAMGLLAETLGSEAAEGGGWLGVVGVPSFGFMAAAEFGLRLDRMIVVEDPGPGRMAAVVAALAEAVDAIVINPSGRIGGRDARRLTARVREQQSVVVHLDNGRSWPSSVDVGLVATIDGWEGIGAGHGCIRGRRATVTAQGRRQGQRPTSVEVWLPNAQGKLAALDAAALAATALSATATPQTTGLAELATVHELRPA